MPWLLKTSTHMLSPIKCGRRDKPGRESKVSALTKQIASV